LAEEIIPKQFAESGVHPLRVLVKGSWEAEFCPAVAPVAAEHIVAKKRYDAFIGTGLERLLICERIRTLIFGGVVTTGCVESTVREAAMRDFRAYLVSDAVEDMDHEAHLQGVARLGRKFAHAVSVDDGWGRSRRPSS
jgi:nicotinamidase-related amidase